MDEKQITIMVMKPGEDPEVKEVADCLKSYREIVRGYIQIVYLTDDIALVCNEEGKLHGLTPNRCFDLPFFTDIVVGNIIFVKVDNETGEFDSLTAKDIERLNKAFCGKTHITEV